MTKAVVSRMVVNDSERTLVAQAREVQRLREKKARLEGELGAVTSELTEAQQALVGALTAAATAEVSGEEAAAAIAAEV